MRFSSCFILTALTAIAGASPVPAIEWVTITAYTTILFSNTQNTIVAESSQETLVAETIATSQTDATSTSETVDDFNLKSAFRALIATSSAADDAAISTASTSQVVTVSPSASKLEISTSTTPATSSSATTSGSFSGEGTFYDTGLGSCGVTNTDTDYIVAISHELYDKYTPNGNPNDNSLCGKKIKASYEGKSVEVTVVDRCEGCAYYDLDFSPSAFSDLASQNLGRIDITWEWA